MRVTKREERKIHISKKRKKNCAKCIKWNIWWFAFFSVYAYSISHFRYKFFFFASLTQSGDKAKQLNETFITLKKWNLTHENYWIEINKIIFRFGWRKVKVNFTLVSIFIFVNEKSSRDIESCKWHLVCAFRCWHCIIKRPIQCLCVVFSWLFSEFGAFDLCTNTCRESVSPKGTKRKIGTKTLKLKWFRNTRVH